MIVVFLKDGTSKEISEANVAELRAITSESLVLRKNEYAIETVATFLRSEVVGWHLIKEAEE